MIALWTFSVYLKQHGRSRRVTVYPAVFMTAVTVSYFFTAPECLGYVWDRLHVSFRVYYPISVAAGIACAFHLYDCFMRGRKGAACDISKEVDP